MGTSAIDLATRYMGLELRNPLIAAPLDCDLRLLRALEAHGAGAIVLPPILEEQLIVERQEFERLTDVPASGFVEAQSYFPLNAGGVMGAEGHIEILRLAKEALRIPIMASLSCVSLDGWTSYARALQGAGADAIQLNIHFLPADPSVNGRDVEHRYLDILAAVKAAVSVPVAVKIGPYFSAIGAVAQALVDGGAGALVLFNRSIQPDIDVATLRVSATLELSAPAELRLPLSWIAMLFGRLPAGLAASGGVDSPEDVYKFLLAGADVVMTTSSLVRHGVGHMRTLVDGLSGLLDARGFASLEEVRGRMSRPCVASLSASGHTDYLRMSRDMVSPVR